MFGGRTSVCQTRGFIQCSTRCSPTRQSSSYVCEGRNARLGGAAWLKPHGERHFSAGVELLRLPRAGSGRAKDQANLTKPKADVALPSIFADSTLINEGLSQPSCMLSAIKTSGATFGSDRPSAPSCAAIAAMFRAEGADHITHRLWFDIDLPRVDAIWPAQALTK